MKEWFECQDCEVEFQLRTGATYDAPEYCPFCGGCDIKGENDEDDD